MSCVQLTDLGPMGVPMAYLIIDTISPLRKIATGQFSLVSENFGGIVLTLPVQNLMTLMEEQSAEVSRNLVESNEMALVELLSSEIAITEEATGHVTQINVDNTL